MTQPDHVQLVRRIYRAFAANDAATLMQAFDENVAMVQVGRNKLAGEFRGRAALFGHFADIPRHTDDMKMENETVMAGGDYVAALNRLTFTKDGGSREFRVIHLFRFAGGKVVELRSIPEDPYGLDEFIG